MTGYQYPGFNQPLIMTGALHKYAGKRLAETHKWWLDVNQQDSFSRFNNGFTSTIYVRFIHSLVRHQLNKSKDWDNDIWGAPINQYDQAMTNIAFSAVLLRCQSHWYFSKQDRIRSHHAFLEIYGLVNGSR
jgi:hypothetical protein